MDHLSVSVVIPTFERATLVPRAVHSALGAVAPGDEVIVVDDGSTDGTEAVLAPYRDRLRYVRTAHLGAGAARNRGVQEARCPLVAFLDSDDEWMSDKLELQRTLMARRPDVLFAFSDFALRDRDGREHRRQLAAWHHDRRSWDVILGPGRPFSTLAPLPAGRGDFTVHTGNLYPALMRACYVSTITMMVRREAGEALRFAEDLPLYEDWECFARLARAGRGAYLACETAWNHGDGATYASYFTDDADFINGVKTIFNNDQDNSAGLGVGKDREFFETYEGKLIDLAKAPVKARYLRFYSKGNTSDDQNHYTEIEVYGFEGK